VWVYNKILSNIIGFRSDQGGRDVLGVNKTNTGHGEEGTVFWAADYNGVDGNDGGAVVVADFKRARKTYWLGGIRYFFPSL